jgi:hypothetical protein
MIKKKAKKADKKTTKPGAKRRAGKKKPKDMAQVREEISEIVKENAGKITVALVDQAVHGQSSQAKYLFEVAKIYPVVEGEEAGKEEDCLAKILLDKLQPPKKNPEEDDGEEDAAGADAVNQDEGTSGEAPPEQGSAVGTLLASREERARPGDTGEIHIPPAVPQGTWDKDGGATAAENGLVKEDNATVVL